MEISLTGIDIHRTCRICLINDNEMCKIFHEESEYSKLLLDCCSVQVDENDGLPDVICQSCIKELMQTHLFINKCQDADKKLRLLLTVNIKVEIDKCDDNYNITEESDIKDADFIEDSDHNGDFEDLPNMIEEGSIRKRKRYKKRGFPKKCSECSTILRTQTLLINHMRTHKIGRRYHCSLCDIYFQTKRDLATHNVSTHNKKIKSLYEFECDYCKKLFFRKSDLKTHIRIHTGETPYSCKLCRRSFNQISSLQRHIKVHTGDRSYKCDICQKAFYTAHCVKKHFIAHLTEKNIPCVDCGAMFKSKETLKSHVTVVHKNSRSVICEQCGIYLSTPGNLRVHIKKFHSSTSGFCFICNKDFKNITEHNLLHSGETPYECNSCGRKFGKKRSLRIHQITHNPTQYACEFEKCNKVYSTKSMLQTHQKFHEKETPHRCKFCSRGFYRPSDLSRHLNLSHSDQPVISAEIKSLRKS